ncbi:MAG: AMP-binding protein [Proteobacteria bacterium]|nr:AMP-binding protein [Pseudomonadota bacterium]
MSLLLQSLAQRASADPGRIALSDGDRNWTYGQLLTEIEAAADRLSALEPSGSRPVAVLLDNGPAWVILDLALISLRRPSLPIPSFFTAPQRAHALSDCGAGVLIEPKAGGELVIAGEPLAVQPLQPSSRALPSGVAKITYTSGSTGAPKGVCLSLGQMEALAAALVETIGADYAGRHLPVLPLAVLLENVASLYPTLLAGGEYRVLPPDLLGLAEPFRPDMGRLTSVIAKSAATSLILVPELLRALIMAMGFTGQRFPALKLVAVGGAKVASELLRRAADVGLPVFEGYGLSECGSVVALNTPAAVRPGTVGRPLPHLSVTVDAGEIVVGPAPFLGYVGDDGPPGVVRTGDLGRLDADGFLHIDGRRSSVIINAFGRNISPEWVESELLAQPEIRQAAVFGEAAPALSAAIVPLLPDLPDTVIAAAVERANAKLPAYARVARWTRRAPFDAGAGEVTGNGRLRRHLLRATTDIPCQEGLST